MSWLFPICLDFLFIVSTSSIGQPVITITPRHLKVPIPVHLAFNQSGAGHYDGAVLCDADQTIAAFTINYTFDESPCSCGKNEQITPSSSLINVYNAYTLKCCKESKPCTNLCRCKTCNNPFGEKNCPQKTPCRHQDSHGSKQIPKSVKFVLDAREHVSSGPRSILEFFV